jgi:hypothetical protein
MYRALYIMAEGGFIWGEIYLSSYKEPQYKVERRKIIYIICVER